MNTRLLCCPKEWSKRGWDLAKDKINEKRIPKLKKRSNGEEEEGDQFDSTVRIFFKGLSSHHASNLYLPGLSPANRKSMHTVIHVYHLTVDPVDRRVLKVLL